MNTLTYQCCFCGNRIESDNFNITALIVVTHWGSPELEREQQLFCHLNCFKSKLTTNVPLYVED